MGDHPVFPKKYVGSVPTTAVEYPTTSVKAVDSQTGVYAHTVDKVIGSAYDTVRYVAENLEYIKHVSAHLAQIYEVYGHLDSIDILAEHIDALNAIYANLTEVLAVSAITDEIVVVAGNIPMLQAINDELDKLTAIYASLDDLIFIADNGEAIVAAGSNMPAIEEIVENLPMLQEIADNMETLLTQTLYHFLTRADLIAYITSHPVTVDGYTYTAGKFDYISNVGATDIPDLPGLVPKGDVHVEHFGAVADMEWVQARFTTTNTGQKVPPPPTLPADIANPDYIYKNNFAPFRISGTNNLAAFQAADNYVTNTFPRQGEFFMDGGIEGVSRSGYYIEGQFILQSAMRSHTGFRNYLWTNNPNVHHSNIWINSVNGGITGINIIPQYSYTGIAKPFGHGQMGCGVTVGTAANPNGGPGIGGDTYSPAGSRPGDANFKSIPFVTDIEIDVRFCRAGSGNRIASEGGGNQRSASSFLFFGVGGIERMKAKVGIFGQTNQSSNGLGICHWNFQYDSSAGGDPLTNYSACIPTETYHACDCEIEIAGHIDMITNPHGFVCVWECASMGTTKVGDISARGVLPFIITPGDLINHYTNPTQKEKVMKGMRIGFLNGIDVPLRGVGDAFTYENSAGANLYVRGFGTSKFDIDVYETTTTRNICRQLECDVTFAGVSYRRIDKAPAWNGRGIYAQGVQGKLNFGAITTFGIGRGIEIEYCDGDQQINYIEGDGCLLYEFSRGGRLLQTDTNRMVPGYVDNPKDGAYRPGSGPATRALSIGGASYSTTVFADAGKSQINTLTKTYIVPFAGADDDVYRGTPLKIGNEWVTATEFIQGRSGGGLLSPGVSIQDISVDPAFPTTALVTAALHGFKNGVTVQIAGIIVGMKEANSKTGVITYINEDTFRWDVNVSGFTPYDVGGIATQIFMSYGITNMTKANPAVITIPNHDLPPGAWVSISGVVGCNNLSTGVSGVNGKSGKMTYIDENTITVAGVNTAALSDYTPPASLPPVNGVQPTTNGLATQNMEGVGYLAHTALTIPAVNGASVLVEEAARLKQLSVTSNGGESAMRMSNASADNCDMHGLRGSGKYAAVMSNARISLKGPVPLTVGTVKPVNTKTITGIVKGSSITTVTCPNHGFTGSTSVLTTFAGIAAGSMVEMNGKVLPVTIMDKDKFTLKLNSSSYTDYVLGSGGTATQTIPNYTIVSDAKGLFSAADGTIGINLDVDFHFKTSSDSVTGMMGRFDIRNCRIEDISKLMYGSQTSVASYNSTLRFCLSMHGCTDIQKNQLLSHPGRQGLDESNGIIGAKGYYNFAEDGILRCWVRSFVTDPAVTELIGLWKNNSTYAINELATDPDTTSWKAVIAHIAPATGTFAAYRAANPTHWTANGTETATHVISRKTWTFPAAFNGGGPTVVVNGNIQSNYSVNTPRLMRFITGSSTHCDIEIEGGPAGQGYTIQLEAVGRWYPDTPL